MKVCGGFTEHDQDLGWRGSCACGWYGPWRDWSLMAVERDVLEHWGECPEHVCEEGSRDGVELGPHTQVVPATPYTTSRDPADRWRVDMVKDTSAVNGAANGGDR